MNTPLNILITGSSGFIGKKVTADLLLKGYYVTAIGRTFPQIEGFEEQFDCIEADLLDTENTIKSLNKQLRKFDIVIHLASVMANASNIDDIRILSDNTKITYTVVEICKLLLPQRLINISSMSVYPNVDGTYSEESSINPALNSDCLYGLSKFNAEVLFNYFLRNTTLTKTHLRLSMVYGVGMPESRIMNVLNHEYHENKTLTIWGNGERILNIISVENFSKMLQIFIERGDNGVYNIGDESISLEELAHRINTPPVAQIIKKTQGNRYKFFLSISKLKSFLHV